MNKVIFIIIILLVGLTGYLFLVNNENEQIENNVSENQPAGEMTDNDIATATDDMADTGDAIENGSDEKDNIIETTEVIYTDSGFSPKEITVAKGATVVFKNESSSDFWPASAMHPTHTVYPGSDIKKCGTSEEVNIFDACKGIAPGGSYSFIFNQVGKWDYHDHLRASNFGSIVVE